VLATVDIERLGREIAESAKRTRESSPEFLQQRIAELEKAGKFNGTTQAVAELAELRSEVNHLRPLAARMASLETELQHTANAKQELVAALRRVLERFESEALSETAAESWLASPASFSPAHSASEPFIGRQPPEHEKLESPISLSSVASSPTTAAPLHDGLTSSEQKVLDALARLEAVGVDSPTKSQLAAFAGYSNPKSGGFAGPAAALLRKGMIESSGGKASLTVAGRETSNKPGRPATTKELQDRIFVLLGEGERKLLTLLIDSYPEPFRRVDLAEKAGYSNAKSGGFASPLARLIELGFAEAVGHGVVKGSEMLFLNRRAGARK
jgi:multidrug efflux pump subunit AcrA (membrane-fusion protein)